MDNLAAGGIEKSKVFYENVLGVNFDEVRPPFSNFYLNGIEFMMEENTPEREDNWEQKYIGRNTGICLQVEDIKKFLDNIINNGGKIVQDLKQKPWGTIEAKFSDLDDNIFIVEQEIN